MQVNFHIPFLAIQISLMILTIIGCVFVYGCWRQLRMAIYVCYSCKHFSQTYMKPSTEYTWAGKTYPKACKECGTTYTYKYLKMFRRYPRYYHIPGFKRVKIDYDE